MGTETQKNIGNLGIFQKRMEVIVGAKLREEDKIAEAVKIQDVIRSKVKAWNGSDEIRKWRQKRG